MTTPITLPRRLQEVAHSGPPLGRNWIRKLNFALAVAWATMIPISILTGWIYSIAFIAAASIYANFISHLAAWRADVPNSRGN